MKPGQMCLKLLWNQEKGEARNWLKMMPNIGDKGKTLIIWSIRIMQMEN